jgi:hypothetical protein
MQDIMAVHLHFVGEVADGRHNRDFHPVSSVAQSHDGDAVILDLARGVGLSPTGRRDQQKSDGCGGGSHYDASIARRMASSIS